MLTLRPYQEAALSSIYGYFQTNTGNPLVVIPTAGGKSLVMASFIEGVLKAWPDQRILIVTHVRELIAQNHAEMIGPCLQHALDEGGHHQALASGGRDHHQRVPFMVLEIAVDRGDRGLLIGAQGQHGAASVVRASFAQVEPSAMR